MKIFILIIPRDYQSADAVPFRTKPDALAHLMNLDPKEQANAIITEHDI